MCLFKPRTETVYKEDGSIEEQGYSVLERNPGLLIFYVDNMEDEIISKDFKEEPEDYDDQE